MPLFHYSEDPTIELFVPRPPLAHPDKEARVWAIDEWHSPLYFLPSECPRVTFWPISTTTPEHLELYWPDPSVRMTIAIEHHWVERFLNTQLYRYEMPEAPFVCCNDHGVHVSEVKVIPLSVEPLRPLYREMAGASVDFRVMPSLKAFGNFLMTTSFHWSFIRMRNSRDWDLPLGEPTLPP